MSVTSERLLTWDEFLALPYETRNTDLINGKLIVNSPNAQHERILAKLLVAIHRWRGEVGRLGEWTTQQPVKINVRRGYQPDASWFPASQCATPDQPAAFSGLPTIVVEVLSPSTRSLDLIRKRDDYERLGIAEFWIIDPVPRSALICRLDDSGRFVSDDLLATDILVSQQLPGFSVILGDLFVD